MMRVTPLQISGKDYFVISHQNITERKQAEDEVRSLAKVDGLTNIPNRRTFDQFIQDEWKRCQRLKQKICLAMVDLDDFKLLNDTYGHQSGDECLIRVGAILKDFGNRPTDICARYGGEEFVLVWGNTSLAEAKRLSNRLLEQISTLNIPNINSSTAKHLTASIGLAEMIPGKNNEIDELISKADSMLFRAKKNGRNKVEN